MKIKNNTVLITGGATGIGYALAESFLKLGNEVIICGRREDKLNEAKKKLPGLHTIVCDISKESGRTTLHRFVNSNFPKMNILVNNAGIQKFVDLKKGVEGLTDQGGDEIEINLRAPISLSGYFMPMLMEHDESAIINVSSGLGFVPLAMFPIYCATKAAMHSYSMSLRHQLKETKVKVFEMVPPVVRTELGGPEKKMNPNVKIIEPSEVADATIRALEADNYEFGMGLTENLKNDSRKDQDERFGNMNR